MDWNVFVTSWPVADSAEKSAGLRKLLEAKDCFVRAAIEAHHPTEEQARGIDKTAASQADKD